MKGRENQKRSMHIKVLWKSKKRQYMSSKFIIKRANERKQIVLKIYVQIKKKLVIKSEMSYLFQVTVHTFIPTNTCWSLGSVFEVPWSTDLVSFCKRPNSYMCIRQVNIRSIFTPVFNMSHHFIDLHNSGISLYYEFYEQVQSLKMITSAARGLSQRICT